MKRKETLFELVRVMIIKIKREISVSSRKKFCNFDSNDRNVFSISVICGI